MRPVDFQQHSQKNQRAISVSCPRDLLRPQGVNFAPCKMDLLVVAASQLEASCYGNVYEPTRP